jgi:hypothetical protein
MKFSIILLAASVGVALAVPTPTEDLTERQVCTANPTPAPITCPENVRSFLLFPRTRLRMNPTDMKAPYRRCLGVLFVMRLPVPMDLLELSWADYMSTNVCKEMCLQRWIRPRRCMSRRPSRYDYCG